MSATFEPEVIEQPAPFPGHPFGGLVREDRFGTLVGLDDGATPAKAAAADTSPASEDAGGFDFHLGVYSRF